MSLLQQAPRLGPADATRLARELYGLDAAASPLPSERDQNVLLTTAAGERFILKIANAAEDRATLEAQNAAMSHLAARVDLCPRVLPTLAGEAIAAPVGGHLVRLVTYLPGVPLADITARTPSLLESLGRAVGRLDAALTGFDHAAIHRDFHWDLAYAAVAIREHLPLVADEGWRGLLQQVSASAQHEVDARASRLRRSAIHNDANDWNVLVAETHGSLIADPGSRIPDPRSPISDPRSPIPDPRSPIPDPRVTGIIDFGDMVHSWTVADPAVAIAYAVLDAADPLATAAAIAAGYHAEHPLGDDELGVLFPMVCLRLCLSACIAARQQRQRPDDEYLTVSQGPIRRTLPVLAAIDPRAAERALRAACGVTHMTNDELLAARRRLTGRNLSLGYRRPVHVVRGSMQYLFDESGRRYIDGYNNVPHVGHCHPRVVEAAARQMSTLNTNTRYLHENLARFGDRLTATLPEPLRVCYFVSSGSEANELALRLARAHTRQRDLIVLDAAYHGNTTTLIDISPYKFNGPGGEGRPPWVHVVPVPDVYRGAFRSDDPGAGAKFADDISRTLERLIANGVDVCGFIAESCPSVAGQIMLPPGYLRAAYGYVREAGGVCIADEVQTAYGRLGAHFYGFEQQAVVPDIVVLGKPIGNGHPIGAVVTTPEIAASFDNGMEFFSTFGGNTVSCAVGLAVLDVLEEDRLQAHAQQVGEHLLARLRSLAERSPLVGDVRGSGLFVGVELVRDRTTLEPAGEEASGVVNRLRDEGILIGTDGPRHNVLKIRPPMPFGIEDADVLAGTLERVLGERG